MLGTKQSKASPSTYPKDKRLCRGLRESKPLFFCLCGFLCLRFSSVQDRFVVLDIPADQLDLSTGYLVDRGFLVGSI